MYIKLSIYNSFVLCHRSVCPAVLVPKNIIKEKYLKRKGINFTWGNCFVRKPPLGPTLVIREFQTLLIMFGGIDIYANLCMIAVINILFPT